MKRLLGLILTLIIFLQASAALAFTTKTYNYHMKIWNEKISLASHYLKKAEEELKSGNKVKSCIQQKKAATYGIEATESLIIAFKERGSKEDISNIKTGLNKWKELRDFC